MIQLEQINKIFSAKRGEKIAIIEPFTIVKTGKDQHNRKEIMIYDKEPKGKKGDIIDLIFKPHSKYDWFCSICGKGYVASPYYFESGCSNLKCKDEDGTGISLVRKKLGKLKLIEDEFTIEIYPRGDFTVAPYGYVVMKKDKKGESIDRLDSWNIKDEFNIGKAYADVGPEKFFDIINKYYPINKKAIKFNVKIGIMRI